MKNIHFCKRTKQFFEGWYLKHDNNSEVIAFIPGINIENKTAKAFIQIITNDGTYQADFDFDDFKASKKEFDVIIGPNRFNNFGIKVDIDIKGFRCFGEIFYGTFIRPKFNIMGPLCVFKNLECNHGILSLFHSLNGRLNVNGKVINFTNGSGYIEKDWGVQFPEKYTWLHFVESNTNNMLIAAVATVPFMGIKVKGHIVVVLENGRQYRFATYNFSKIKKYNDAQIFFKKGRYKLEIYILDNEKGYALKAPVSGAMKRTIFERLQAKVKVRFYKGRKLIFERDSNRASLEIISGN